MESWEISLGQEDRFNGRETPKAHCATQGKHRRAKHKCSVKRPATAKRKGNCVCRFSTASRFFYQQAINSAMTCDRTFAVATRAGFALNTSAMSLRNHSTTF